ncbi:hypothetical protein RND81_08G162300 [Saponaria officinalis]|uniref:Glutaredoxin domain-containing protein n=1 Tax=Saponaria officinalis TaxID=3572 RepID=A0AAW1J893_SAPOF
MKGIIKTRFLKRFRTVNPNNKQQDSELGLYVGKKNGDNNVLALYELNLPNKEIDVFEECECEFHNSIPNMISSSSSSSTSTSISSSGSSPKSNGTTTESILDFELKSIPGGNDKVILYTTSLRGIRKTYEDCRAIKFLLESFRVVYFERDVSMDLEFRDELWRVLGKKGVPPRLFIEGRDIGGAEEVVTLHECGVLKVLLEGIPKLGLGESVVCRQCGGVGFLVCVECSGSCKVYKGDHHKNGGMMSLFCRCPKCNENGLVKCSTCSC